MIFRNVITVHHCVYMYKEKMIDFAQITFSKPDYTLILSCSVKFNSAIS